MKIISSKKNLNELLFGMRLESSTLDKLISECETEDLYVEYKSGLIFQKSPKELAHIVREYVTAFANSDGGVIIFGISKSVPRVVDGCPPPPGGGSLHDWAARCLTDIAPYLSPTPRIHTVSHPNGEVLVIATQRASVLVPCVESGKLTYYIRIGDQTIACPPYLISDLLLGRRQTPVLSVAVEGLGTEAIAPYIELQPLLKITNTGLISVEAIKVGCVFWTFSSNFPAVPEIIRRYIDIEQPSESIKPFGVCHFVIAPNQYTQSLHDIDPWETKSLFGLRGLVVPYFDFTSEIKAAIYVLPKGEAPIWYQFSFQYSKPELMLSEELLVKKMIVSPTWNERPKVSWIKST